MDAAQRQAARGLLDMAAQRYIPPELRGLLGLVAEANPVVSMERAGTAAQGLLGRQATPMQRVGYAGDMLSNMAGVVAPAMVASRAGLPAAQALQESVMGFSQAAGIPEFIADESGALRLYHGSPHDFDKFSMDKIGTGEGAQAYGHGLYFAESEGVARSYRDALAPKPDTRMDPMARAWNFANEFGYNDKELIYLAQDMRDNARTMRASGSDYGLAEAPILEATADAIESGAWKSYRPPAGRMYEVEVNANPEDFLDWDAPLSAQPQKVREAINRTAPPKVFHSRLGNEYRAYLEGPGGIASSFSGATRDDALEKAMQGLTGENIIRSNVPTMISKELRDQGIPGIRYLDAGSRGAGDGSRNYVVFDENLISIVRKYGIAGAAALYGVSQADIAQAMNPTTDRQTGLLMAQTPPRAD